MRFGLPNQGGVRDGINGHGLLEQAIEEFPAVARLAPVETEGEFVQVVLQVLPGHPPRAVCGAEPRASEALVLSPSGGVKNAVVFLAHERMEGWRSPMTFQIDQRRCAFVPRVLIVPPAARIEVLNSDGILHNFHTLGRVNPSLNLGQPARARPLRVTFDHPEIVQVKCDLHGEGFMRAWIVVASHPYYALTDEDGQFRLPDLPQGPHVLEVWHEVLGTTRVPVSVGASGEVKVTIKFTPGPKRRSSRNR